MPYILTRVGRVGACTLVLLTRSAGAQPVSFRALGPPTSGGSAITPDGATVVGNSNNRAVRWDRAGTLTPLGGPPGDQYALGTSDSGAVIVGFFDTGNGDHAARWVQGAGFFDLGTLPGGSGSTARGVSGDGLVIVGESSIPPQSGNVFNRAFRWTEAGGMQSLGVLSGATDSIALGVSRDAAVIVGFNYSLSTTDPRAFKWTAAQGMTELPVLPGGSGALATAASLDGSIVVGLSETTHGAGERAARWTPGGVENLGILPGAEFGRAEAVSGDGSAVVGYNHFASSGLDQAFFWNPTNGMQDLKAFLVASGINLSGWNLIDANGVSADGLTIVGYGITPAGQIEGWVATIPTPTAAYPLFLVLLAGSLRNRAHRATADGADQRRS